MTLRRARPWLGTLVEITAMAEDAQSALAAIEAGFAEIATVHRLMSFHEPASDLSRLNRASPGTAIDVDARTAEVLGAAAALHLESDGAFDCAIGDVSVGLGLLPALAAADAAGAAAIERPHSVVRGPGLIDLGGIAKGYAVDRAIEAMLRIGAGMALVNAGGDLRHHGEAPIALRLRDPTHAGRVAAVVQLCNAALASSATSGLAAQPGAPSALIDPRGRASPLPPGAGVSIVAPSCMMADALTKVVLVTRDPAHRALSLHGASVVFYQP